MKCPHCNESLAMFKGNTKVKVCPFCTQPLDVDFFLTTAKEKLAYMVSCEGKDILKKSNRDKLDSLMEKWPAPLNDDRDIFRLLSIKNIPDAIVNASECSGESSRGILTECLDSLCSKFCIPKSDAVRMMTLVADPLKLDLQGILNGTEEKNEGKSDSKNIFVDSKDGTSYKTVRIGKMTWIAENYRYDAPGSFAPKDDSSNVAACGRLYKWSDAMALAPKGWRLPTIDELHSVFGNVILRLPLGGYKSPNGIYNFGLYGYLWAGDHSMTSASMYYCSHDGVFKWGDVPKNYALPVRYVKD